MPSTSPGGPRPEEWESVGGALVPVAGDLPEGRVPVRALPERWSWLAWVLDDMVAVPGTGGRRRFGLDGVISLVPGLGDAAGFALAVAIIAAGFQAGVSKPTLLRMTVHAGGEALLGMIPGIGTVSSFVWKANNRNLRLIEADLADRERTRRSSVALLVGMVGLVALTILMFVIGIIGLGALVVWAASRAL